MTFDSTWVQAARVTLGLGELYIPTTSRLFTPERSPGLELPRQKAHASPIHTRLRGGELNMQFMLSQQQQQQYVSNTRI